MSERVRVTWNNGTSEEVDVEEGVFYPWLADVYSGAARVERIGSEGSND